MREDHWNFNIFRRQYSVTGKSAGLEHGSNPCFPFANHMSLGILPCFLELSVPVYKILMIISILTGLFLRLSEVAHAKHFI